MGGWVKLSGLGGLTGWMQMSVQLATLWEQDAPLALTAWPVFLVEGVLGFLVPWLLGFKVSWFLGFFFWG